MSQSNPQQPDDAREFDDPGQPAWAGGPEPTESQPTEPSLESLQRERDELEAKLLRVAADYQNYARRAEQNMTAAKEQQAMDFARGLVGVLDHFDHALEVDPKSTTTADLQRGVVMVRDELLRALGRIGIERMDVTPGEPFDPNHHEALMRQPSEDMETDHVLTQLQPGYVLRDKTIRPAKVSVAE